MLVRLWNNRNSHLLLGKYKMIQPLWESLAGFFVCLFFNKLNIPLSHNPAIMLLAIYTKELKNHVHTKASVGEWIKSMGLLHFSPQHLKCFQTLEISLLYDRFFFFFFFLLQVRAFQVIFSSIVQETRNLKIF